MQIKEFRIRCSAIGLIMGEMGLTDKQTEKLEELNLRYTNAILGKAKPLTDNMDAEMKAMIVKRDNAQLPQTCKSYLQEWIKEQVYNEQKQIKSKYLTKGIEVENAAIDYYSEINDLGFLVPSDVFFTSEFIQGTPDLIVGDTVYDFKSSWDCFTFPLFETEIDKGYWSQLQGYMFLTERKKARLVYTLQNTPEELVFDTFTDYTDIDSKFRIKEFAFNYDKEFIKSVEDRVKLCRVYIADLITKL